ncbi:hypothetical protein MBLNU13_g11720t1 [Cladosporium sp. NU13]
MAHLHDVDKITPDDERVQNRCVEDGGHKWHYLEALPEGKPKGTIVLIHGFPDMSLGWRYQIPHFMKLGYRTIALDCMGYGKTGYSPNLSDYGFLAHANAIAAIARNLNVSQLILGGHDWGGATVYRVAQWYPSLIAAVFAVATPYNATSKTFTSTETLAKGKLPNFGYQLQLGSEGGVMEGFMGDDRGLVEKFLNGMYGGRTSSRRKFMVPEKGVDLDVLRGDEIGKTPFFEEKELAFYTDAFYRNNLAGPMNWYRTRRVNYEDELKLPEAQKNHIAQPVLFIQAAKDDVLVPAMSVGMERVIPDLTRAEVPTGHWALWQAPGQVNEIVGKWLGGLDLSDGEGGKSKL